MKFIRDVIIILLLSAALGALYNFFAPKPLPWFKEERTLTFVDDSDLFKPKPKNDIIPTQIQYTCSNTVFIIVGIDSVKTTCQAFYPFKKASDLKLLDKIASVNTEFTKYIQFWTIGDTLSKSMKELYANKIPLKSPFIETIFIVVPSKNQLDSLVKLYE